MVQSITAAVTKSVLGELQKAGIIAGHRQHDSQSITQRGGPANDAHPDQNEDNELSQTVATAPPDEHNKGHLPLQLSTTSIPYNCQLCYLQTQPKTRWFE